MRSNSFFSEPFNKPFVEQGFPFAFGSKKEKILRLWITPLALLLKGRIKKRSFGSFTGQMEFRVVGVCVRVQALCVSVYLSHSACVTVP